MTKNKRQQAAAEQRAHEKTKLDLMFAERYAKIEREFKEMWRTATPETQKQIIEASYSAMLEQAKQVAAMITKGTSDD